MLNRVQFKIHAFNSFGVNQLWKNPISPWGLIFLSAEFQGSRRTCHQQNYPAFSKTVNNHLIRNYNIKNKLCSVQNSKD